MRTSITGLEDAFLAFGGVDLPDFFGPIVTGD
jgi:hypothetical protein